MVDPIELTSLDQFIFIQKILFTFFYNMTTLSTTRHVVHNQRLNFLSDDQVIYNSFPACARLRTSFEGKFLVGHKLQLLSHKVHAHHFCISCLGHSQTTSNTNKCLYLSPSQLMLSSFTSCSQTTKNQASGRVWTQHWRH